MPNKRVATAVVVPRIREDGGTEVLMQLKRKNNAWEFPIGKLKGAESVEECARRKLGEETDINARKLAFYGFVDSRKYCIMLFIAEEWGGKAQIMEPEEQPGMGWFPVDALPEPLTRATKAAVAQGVLTGLAALDAAAMESAEIEREDRLPWASQNGAW